MMKIKQDHVILFFVFFINASVTRSGSGSSAKYSTKSSVWVDPTATTSSVLPGRSNATPIRKTSPLLQQFFKNNVATKKDVSATITSIQGNNNRSLQDDENSEPFFDSCQVCFMGEMMTDNLLPLYYYEANGGLVPDYMTCGEIQEFFAVPTQAGSDDCLGLQSLFPFCCSSTIPPWQCEQETRRQILPNMDTMVPPTPSYQIPTTVYVTLWYHTVSGINVQEGTAEIYVWLEMNWNDPRLKWTVSYDNSTGTGTNTTPKTCATVVSVRASIGGETTEIWIPEFDLLNRVSSVYSFEDAHADVFPDGTVFWRRSGPLKAICQFQGLAKIPYDDLGCQLFFGTQQRLGFPGEVQFELDPVTGGFVLGDFAPTYAEYNIIPSKINYTKVADANGGFLQYQFYFERARSHYIFGLIIPTAILTYVSFGTFLLDFRVGERLSYGMALALVVVAQQIVTADLLPVSNAKLWMEKFVIWSFYWVIFGLVESVIMAYFFFIREDKRAMEQERPQQQPPQQQTSPQGREATTTNNVGRTTKAESVEQETSSSPKITIKDGGVVEEETDEYLHNHQVETTTTAKKRRHPLIRLVRSLMYTYPLRKIDFFCFIFCIVSYTSFLIVMLTTQDLWGGKVDPIYAS